MKDIINVARISGTHHMKGTVKAISVLDEIDVLDGQKVLVEGVLGDKKLLTIDYVQELTNKKILIKFEEVNSIEDARRLNDSKVYIRRELLGNLSKDEYYLFDLIDMDVYTEEGENLGKLENILSSTVQDVYVINEDKENEIMIPAVDEFILDIDFDKNRMTVRLIEGMR